MNFFCHAEPRRDPAREAAWRRLLEPYYAEGRTGAKIISSATTVDEARWLERRGVDAVIAMGAEAGGHRGSFLTDDMATQAGTMALVPRVVDAVAVPVMAAGGIADRRRRTARPGRRLRSRRP